MDVRKLKSGHIRVRFKLGHTALGIVEQALSKAPGNFPNSSINVICMHFLGGGSPSGRRQSDAVGKNRILFKLHPEQYENLLAAMGIEDASGQGSESAITEICRYFLTTFEE